MGICRPVKGEGLAGQHALQGIEQVMTLLAGRRAVTFYITEAGDTNRRGREVPSSLPFAFATLYCWAISYRVPALALCEVSSLSPAAR